MKENLQVIYKQGQDKLTEAGIHDAAFDARALLSFVMEIPFRDIPLHYMDEAADEQQERYEELIGRRMSGEPLQYITGEQEFMGLTFHVDSRVLIPRLDTEILAEEALEYVNRKLTRGDAVRVLDLCCGSGALGLSIAALHSETDRLEVVISDISEDALEVARQNAEALGVSDRVAFVKGDLFENIEKSFDVIVCNPPYIRTDVIETLDKEVREHEPMLALDGGADGLDIYRRIAEEAPGYLKAGGRLLMEIGYDQAEEVAELLYKNLQDVRIVKDLAGLDRVVSARMK